MCPLPRGEIRHPPLRAHRLRWRCDPSSLPFETTEDLQETDGFIDQQRAKKALSMGLKIQASGYHILVCGPPGTGRKALVEKLVRDLREAHRDRKARRTDSGKDLLYLHNFRDFMRPLAVSLPPGKGSQLRDAMEGLVQRLEEKVPALLASDYVERRKKSLIDRHERLLDSIRCSFEEEVAKRSFCLLPGEPPPGVPLPQFVPCTEEAGPTDMDTLRGKARTGEISGERYRRLLRDQRELAQIRRRLLVRCLEAERSLSEKIEEEVRESIADLVRIEVGALKRAFRHKGVRDYLAHVEAALLDYYSQSRCAGRCDRDRDEASSPCPGPDCTPFFRVNLIVDARDVPDMPFLYEPFPSLQNLFGTIGASRADQNGHEPEFLTILPGAFHRAQKGFLLLDLNDVVHDERLWRALKQCLRTNLIEIPPPSSTHYAVPTIRPEPFPLETKVIGLIDEDLYQDVLAHDPEIEELFKIRADFEDVIERTRQHMLEYCAFLKKLAREESLPAFHRTAAAALLEAAVERAGRQSKLTARLSDIADIAREAAYWALQDARPVIEDRHVEKALAERRYRNSLPDEQVKELIQEGTIRIETDGERVGQVNGIALYDLGDYVFATPCRITAQTSMGRAGLINIEREANLSGKLHDKGVLILYGYLRDRYAHDKPLNLSASICIEQFYTDIEGDSATLAEICTLLSSLSGIPVRQSIAVTGSISQKGEVQPVGCVNEKIRGFFEVCRQRGLTGDQGVIIPAGNVPDLMLPVEIVRAVEQGRFHVYEAHTVDDAMEILTGLPAGTRSAEDGSYPEESINRLVDDRLRELAEGLRDFYNEVPEEEERWGQE